MVDIMGHFSRDERLDPPITGLLEICTNACQYDVIPEEYKAEFLSWGQDIQGARPTRQGLLKFYELTGAAANPSHHLNSPLLWPHGHQRIPPVYFQVHGRDYVRDSSLIYERILRERDGVKTKLKVYPGVPHG
jgi:acetyl esterase/lipase